MTTVVTGATGTVGRMVVQRLVRVGENVRAVTRAVDNANFPAGVETVGADLLKPSSLRTVFDGADRLYLFPVPQTAEEIAKMAAAAGVRRVVVLSSGAVTTGHDTNFHLPVEKAVEASGLEWTHLRPGEFAVNTLHLWGPSIRDRRTVVDPYPDQLGQPVHEADIADVAVAALLEDGHAGAAYTMVGPNVLSHRQQVNAIEAAVGEQISIQEVTAAQARDYYHRQGGWAAASADFLFGFETYSGAEPGQEAEPAGHPPASLPTAERVTGRAARTFAQWARDHRDDFS